MYRTTSLEVYLFGHDCFVEWQSSSHTTNPFSKNVHWNRENTNENVYSSDDGKDFERALIGDPRCNKVIHS